MLTLFESEEKPRKKGNPYHSRSGKYTDKKTAQMELAIKRAEMAENKLAYVMSCYKHISRQHSQLSREMECLKKQLKKVEYDKSIRS